MACLICKSKNIKHHTDYYSCGDCGAMMKFIKKNHAELLAEKYGDEKHPSGFWRNLIGITILDPDGWDRKNLEDDFDRPITLKDFLIKASCSTTDANELYLGLIDYYGR